jgi:hypothetical protein
MAYTVRRDINEERRKQLDEAASAVVPNKFSGYITLQLIEGKLRNVYQEKEEQ